MRQLAITEEPATALAEYARIAIAFEVRRVLDVTAPANGLGGLVLTERAIDTPYIKDYDEMPGESPTEWPGRFDVTPWAFLIARTRGVPVGAAAVAVDTPDLHLLEGRSDIALLWDIRVAPDRRGQGVGSALFHAAEAWAAARGCRRMNVETQNVNVPACRFYVSQGCYLGAIRRFAYAELPDEVQLLWYRDLSASALDGPAAHPGTTR